MRKQSFFQRWSGGPQRASKTGSRCVVRGAETLERRELLSAGGGKTPSHYTYESMKTQLVSWAAQYGSGLNKPDLVQLVRIGQGAQAYKDPIINDPLPETSRGLWAIKISDHASLEDDGKAKDEPDVKYISTMHGNEPLGMEMDMRFINDLLTKYGTDQGITDLVNNNEIWVLPLMNPDGLASDTRSNYNGYDLNRSFPELAPLDPYATSKPALATLEANLPTDKKGNCAVPEVKAVMDWSAQHHFVLAANFHTGNLLVNYPYDYDGSLTPHYATSPDDALYVQLAGIYASNNSYMLAGSPYTGGIVNGSLWKPITGGMQDFDYRYFGTKHVTVELYPGYDYGTKNNPIDLDAQWSNNKQAMLAYLEQGIVLVQNASTPSANAAAVDWYADLTAPAKKKDSSLAVDLAVAGLYELPS